MDGIGWCHKLPAIMRSTYCTKDSEWEVFVSLLGHCHMANNQLICDLKLASWKHIDVARLQRFTSVLCDVLWLFDYRWHVTGGWQVSHPQPVFWRSAWRVWKSVSRTSVSLLAGFVHNFMLSCVNFKQGRNVDKIPAPTIIGPSATEGFLLVGIYPPINKCSERRDKEIFYDFLSRHEAHQVSFLAGGAVF